MKELLKDIFYLGAGAAFITREKIDEFKKELIEKGKMTQEEGRQFVEELMKKSEDVRTEMEKKVQDAVADRMQKMNVASREDIAELKAEIEKIKAEIKKNKTRTA